MQSLHLSGGPPDRSPLIWRFFFPRVLKSSESRDQKPLEYMLAVMNYPDRFDDAPFAVAEFIAHDFEAPVWDLELRSGPRDQWPQQHVRYLKVSGPMADIAKSTRLTHSRPKLAGALSQ